MVKEQEVLEYGAWLTGSCVGSKRKVTLVASELLDDNIKPRSEVKPTPFLCS
jgi:hypothetical protein